VIIFFGFRRRRIPNKQMTLSMNGQLSLGSDLDLVADILPSVVDRFLLVTNVDGHRVSIRYIQRLKILIVVIAPLDLYVAVHAEEIETAIKLAKRTFWREEKRCGFVRLVDDSCVKDEWMSLVNFEKALNAKMFEEQTPIRL